MNGPAIVAHAIHKHYRRGGHVTPVLRGVDLTVEAGECVFLVGPSGSGKSTLLSILGCVLTPDRGEVRVLGMAVNRFNEQQRARLRRDGLGFVFQRLHLLRGLSALENVSVPLVLQGAFSGQARRRAEEILERVGLAEHASHDPRRLSVGQCQRVAIARALVGDPKIILADEPTAALDGTAGREVLELLRELASQEGRSVVVVTHDERIYRYADRIYRLDGGKLTALGGADAAAEPATLGA